MRRMTSPFCTPIFAYSESGTIENSLKPLATPFLNEGTILALVARSERFVSALLISLRATTYWFSESCLTPSPPPPACACGAPPASGIGATPRFGGAAAERWQPRRWCSPCAPRGKRRSAPRGRRVPRSIAGGRAPHHPEQQAPCQRIRYVMHPLVTAAGGPSDNMTSPGRGPLTFCQ